MNTIMLFANLLLAHIIGDFYLQGKGFCLNKILKALRSKELWIHALINGLLSWGAFANAKAWFPALLLMVLHLLIDWIKVRLQLRYKIYDITNNELKPGDNKRYDIILFVVDQILHVLVIYYVAKKWILLHPDWSQIIWLQNFIDTHPLWVKTVFALSLALRPANILVVLLLDVFKVNITVKNDTDKDEKKHGNFHSGELIGCLERGLLLLFVIMSQYEAIGFLIAAKSILRFNDTTKGDEKSEYVLSGTLLSLAIALCLGISVVSINIKDLVFLFS